MTSPRPLRRHLGALFALAIVSASPLKAENGDDLAWLAGDWCGTLGSMRIEERWIARGQHLLGLSVLTAGDALREFEYLRVEPREGALAFVAQPQGRPPTVFALVEQAEHRATFANPAHDFPQRITYWRDAAGLHAEAAGPGNDGAERVLRFDYTIACED